VRSTLLSALRSLVLAVPLALVGVQLYGLMGLFGGISVASVIAAIVGSVWSRSLRRPPPVSAASADTGDLRGLSAPVRDTVDALLDAVAAIPGITVVARPINTLGFYVRGIELGHVHRGGELDVHLPPEVRDEVISTGGAEHHRHVNDCGWLTYRMRSPEDVREAAWLLELGAALHSACKADDSSCLATLEMPEVVRLAADRVAARAAMGYNRSSSPQE